MAGSETSEGLIASGPARPRPPDGAALAATSLTTSGQQWDQPNGWAPLQWVAVVGLKDYHKAQLAETIARRWSCENVDGYHASGTLVEKYNLLRGGASAGGERHSGRLRLDQRRAARARTVVSELIEPKSTALRGITLRPAMSSGSCPDGAILGRTPITRSWR